MRESLISILREKNRDSHFSDNRAALVLCGVAAIKIQESEIRYGVVQPVAKKSVCVCVCVCVWDYRR